MKRTVGALVALASLTGAVDLPSSAQTVYYLVREFGSLGYWNDSFALPISEPEDIAHARRIVAARLAGRDRYDEWEERFIPVMFAAKGPDGINRDHLVVGKPEWSWHVTTLLGWTGIGLDSPPSPTELERAVEGVSDYPFTEYVSFFYYSVSEELGPALSLAIEPRTEGATFRWPDLSTNRVCAVGGTNFVYTLEAKTTLAQTNWWAVAGAAWPLKTNGWTMTGPQASPAFYRTRADLAPP